MIEAGPPRADFEPIPPTSRSRATASLGDPAVDLIPAWNLLPSAARQVFREAVDTDDASWARGRGWALSMAIIQLPYYRKTNPVTSANARYVIRQVLAG